jgi:hypothetical protein
VKNKLIQRFYNQKNIENLCIQRFYNQKNIENLCIQRFYFVGIILKKIQLKWGFSKVQSKRIS